METTTKASAPVSDSIIGNEASYLRYILMTAKWLHGKSQKVVCEESGLLPYFVSRQKLRRMAKTPTANEWARLCATINMEMKHVVSMSLADVETALDGYSEWDARLREIIYQKAVKEKMKQIASHLSMSNPLKGVSLSPVVVVRALQKCGFGVKAIQEFYGSCLGEKVDIA